MCPEPVLRKRGCCWLCVGGGCTAPRSCPGTAWPGMAWHGCHLIWELQGHQDPLWGGPVCIPAGFVKRLEWHGTAEPVQAGRGEVLPVLPQLFAVNPVCAV